MDEDVRRKDEKLFLLIIKTISEQNMYQKLELAYLLTFNIRQELALRYEVEEFRNGLREILKNDVFIRQIHHRQSIINEDGTIYFGEEHLDCPYNYNEEVEKSIIDLRLNITEFLATILGDLDLPVGLSFDSLDISTPKKK